LTPHDPWEKFYRVYTCILVYMSSMTTIRISHQTKEILDDLKHHPRESYEDVIGRLATMACDDDPLSDEEIEDMKESLDDIKAGRVKTLKTLRKEMGI
jgi:hypothetical protein